MTALDLVFQYRTLLGRCEVGAGLDLDGIEALTELEVAFAPGDDDRYARDGRRFRREPVVLRGLLRGGDINDRVVITDLSLGGARVTGAPFATEGDRIELVIDHGEDSFRFKAEVKWVRDEDDDYALGLAFVGLPVHLHYGPASEAPIESAIHRIAA